MKQLRRLIASLLCMIMIIPSQGITVLADAIEVVEGAEEIERLSKTFPLEMIGETEEELPRIEEPLNEGIIYWNPDGELPKELATASNGQVADSGTWPATASNAWTATVSNAPKGNDNADGRTPSTPVKTLAKALTRAEELMEEEGLVPAAVTIYAMNPMEVADGHLYVLNGGNLNIKSWPGRTYDSDVIFYINGGQLTMMNVRLVSGNQEHAEDEAQLIYVRGGAFQLGQNAILEGRAVLDYRSRTEDTVWETATASDVMADIDAASPAVADAKGEEVSFDLNEYILDSSESSIELIEDRVSAGTWCDPIIELLEGFDGGAGEYLLELLADGSAKEIELVKTLYSDAETEEEFLGFFTLVENLGDSWNLQVETQAAARTRTKRSTFGATEVLTSKTLVAARADGSGKEIYWNPGGNIVIGGVTYYGGDDVNFAGTERYPVKTWEKAVEYAEGGTIICMQTLDLGSSGADNYLQTMDDDGNYLLKSSSAATMVALSTWPSNPQPAFRVPEGETLVLRDVALIGMKGTNAQSIVCDRGEIIVEENVIAETGYIQITAFREMDPPVKVTSTNAEGKVTLFFGGINSSYDYCYMDVVVPHGELAARISDIADPDAAAAEAAVVGQELLNRFQLHPNHQVSGGNSKFDWVLRQDTDEDDSLVNAQNLELYAMYYFDAIYLDGVNGDDSYYGATCQYPVKTWARAQERWAYEMKKSVDARWAASAEGKSAAEIEEFYPLPKTIYICGTITVADSEEWDLWAYYLSLDPSLHQVDYDGSTIVTEVVSHVDVSYQEDGATLKHEIPKILVTVTDGADLKIKDVTFRNMTDDADSVTIQVEAGGSLTLKGNTLLTGKRLAQGSITAKEVTLGTHVKVLSNGINGGRFVMDETWEGAIEKRQHGVNASGIGTKVTMDNGFIRENNSFEQAIYDAGLTNHKPGAGVLLSDKAEFTMNGGKITGNAVYQYGAGVYMVGEGTSFVMKEGEISDNKMSVNNMHKNNTSAHRGAGIGIYAEAGTILKIGDESAQKSKVLITGNVGYLADGAGIWCDSELTITNATISANSIGGYSTGYLPSYGIGISVGTNGQLTMDDAVITDNYSADSKGDAFGAGIYFASGTNEHSIKNSIISGNKVNFESWGDYDVVNMSRGGGIYIAGGKLNIEDSEISYNEACLGGGICSYAASSTYRAEIKIEKTIITENKARSVRNINYGSGGGIYQYNYSTITLKDGVEITNNTAAAVGTASSSTSTSSIQRGYGGGGIYICGYGPTNTRLTMEKGASEGIQISGNKSLSGLGGGIFHYNASVGASGVEINQNEAAGGGGISTFFSSAYGYYKDVEISENKALNGAGLYLLGSPYYYMQDSGIKDNVASGSGGGIYLGSSSAILHLTETGSGDFELTGNHAEDFGGGVCLVNSSNLTMNIAGPIQNSANTQGSNFYVGGYGAFYILDGEFKQPEEEDRREGVYNLYIDDRATSAYLKSFDMSSVTVEKKSGSSPDVIYLNTTNSYLTYLAAPPNNDTAIFPIDLNTDVFKPGSIVAKVTATTASTNVNVTVLRPDSTLTGTASEVKAYGSGYMDASTNLSYFSGGKIPRRTQLGGFVDAVNSGRINVVVLGEGVYLSGSGKDDDENHDGSSPAKAVKTFKRAKEVLEERITDRRIQDDERPAEEEKTGFSPFIYICGPVNIESGEEGWELDYDDALFTDENQYYALAETANGETVYPAQVRRFASFVRSPMIQVGTGIAFTTNKIIIDGMADAVITTDQGQYSPIIKGLENSTVTLNEKSQITNNYYSGLDIYGKLILRGSASGVDDKQIYNHHGSFVRLYASSMMRMEEGAKILADSDQKTGSIAGYGIQILGAGVSVEMVGSSAIEQAQDSSLLAAGGIYSTQANTEISMQEEARILNAGNGMTYGIYLTGPNSVLEMQDNANITTRNNYIQYGISIAGTDVSANMKDNANITREDTVTSTTAVYGINAGGTRSKVTMEGNANITWKGTSSSATMYGIAMNGTGPEVIMKGNANITYDMLNTSSYRYGIGLSGTNPKFEMQGKAKITGSEGYKLTYGLYLSSTTNAEISMNMNSDSLPDDSARISDATYGVYFIGAITSPVDIQMGRYAAIEHNQYGLMEYEGNTSNGVTKLNLEMKDDSRISGNSANGIRLNGYRVFTEGSDYQRITLKDRAVIGGAGYYSSTDGTSGNQNAGIYANSPIQLTMNGNSRISGNGSSDVNTSSSANGVYLTRRTGSYYRSGSAKITLNDSASICNNRGGVYVSTTSETNYPNNPNTCVIELNGINADESLSSPSIRGNTDGIYLGRQGTLQLKGGAILGDTTYASSVGALNCYGYLELDGRSIVEGLLYMQDGERPITMTHEATGSLQKYKLYLREGFLGQIVVKPGGNTPWDLTAPDSQLPYFNKTNSDGMVAGKDIVPDAPNLVLQGENNVYLSGSGDDSNIGNSKATSVRTFKRAKELLEGGEAGGYFTAGANIIICTTTVAVEAGDEDWSFGMGGYVANAKSNQTWRPLVIRDEAFKGIMVTLPDSTAVSYATTVTFKDITIDGGSEQGIVLTTTQNDQLLYVGTNKTAILGENAVLQNNKAVATSYSDYSAIGVKVYRGTLQIDGGTIRNVVRETSGTFSNYWFASAIVGQSGTSGTPAKIIMNSGQIVDNELNCPNAYGTNARLGTIYLVDQYTSMEMNGGLISNNKVVTRATNPAAAGALVIYLGSATINGGVIRGNAGGCGSAIFYNGGTTSGSSLILSGGQISGQITNASSGSTSGVYSPIYITEGDFQLKGGGTNVQDSIYLSSSNSLIKVSGQIYQTNRRYRVYLNQGTSAIQFKKGSVVVQPDGNHVTDTTPYLSYFDVRTTPYVLDQGRIDQAAGVNQSAVVGSNIKESQCLILMKAVYLDSVNGLDSRDGLTPVKAVKTFARAKAIGGASDSSGTTDSYNHYIIYISGKASNAAVETWSLPKFAYMCRYTGFDVYSDSSGTVTTGNRAYYGSLIEPAYNLTLEDIAIYGRRTVDTVTNNGSSLVHIKTGIMVNVQTDAILADNYNMSSYLGEDGLENLNSKGGAFHVEAGGILQMDGGVIRNTEATYGSAIYLGASETDQTDSGRGRLILTGTPEVLGKVYLSGTGTVTAAYIEPEESYHPSRVLQISIENDYNGRPVIQYRKGVTPGTDELEYYLFDDAIKAIYDIVNRAAPDESILELSMREVIYLDGRSGDDDNDGLTPETAYRTLKQVYSSVGEQEDKYGVVVFVVDTVEISGTGGDPAKIELMNVLVKDTNGNSHYEGYYKEGDNGEKINIRGQVYFKRYAQPRGYTSGESVYDGFAVPTLKESLFEVTDGGTLTMKGIYLDGHAQDSDNSNPTLVANGVTAMSPLVTVEEGGILHCLLADGVSNGVSTVTLFTNNINGNQKAKAIGTLNASTIMEGSGAGIELLDGGECHLQYTEFSNLHLGENIIAGGTDIYSNGALHVSKETHFSGTVYLEGLWTVDNKTNSEAPSRYITVDIYGDPIKTNFQVLMRDPYMGRDVVHYPNIVGVEPPLTDIGYYRLEERVKDYFCLQKRNGESYIFELQVPTAVYIDGLAGDDGINLEDAMGRAAGSTPKTPVRSLYRAFELLNTRGGNTIYVVGTVQISANTQVTGMSYAGTEGTVLLGGTSKVKLARYIQPDFAFDATSAEEIAEVEAAGYDVTDFNGVLLNVRNGAVAELSNGLYLDGHSEPKINTNIGEYTEGEVVSRHSEANAPMITVETGGTLTLSEGSILQDNNNAYADGDSTGQNGGAIANSGTVNVNGALFENNQAKKGSVVYQNGTFNLQSKPENLSNHANAFYLTTSSGTNHVIRTAVAIPDEMVFDVDMDNAIKGRPVVRFTDSSAYSPNIGADAEHEHFKLGSTVSPELFLVESELNPELLELQNWEILKVEVPANIYLVMSRKGTYDVSTKLQGVMADASAGNLFSAPEYKIENRGNYAAKVSISGFANQTQDVGIDTALYPLMNLTDNRTDVLSSTDLYLAIKGLDGSAVTATGSGFGMGETSLKPYAEESVTEEPVVLGTLRSGTTGNFTFVGAVGAGFMEQYLDPGFPLEGVAGSEAQAYMDGTSGTGMINARAKYLLRYKVEIDPSRRESASGSTP